MNWKEGLREKRLGLRGLGWFWGFEKENKNKNQPKKKAFEIECESNLSKGKIKRLIYTFFQNALRNTSKKIRDRCEDIRNVRKI
jgi:hypothetical protein